MSEMEARANGWGKSIRGVILDYGEVLCRRPDREQLARMSDALGLEMEAFTDRYQRDRSLCDRGDFTASEYWSRLMQGATLDQGVLKKLREWDVEMWSNLDPAMIDWLDRLSGAGFKTAVLSNMHPDMALYARSNFEWLGRRDCFILSCEVRLVKPDHAIYDRCVRGLVLKPSEALFIDDREPNVLAAQEAGLAALQFKSVEQLQDALENIRFPVRPLA